MSMLENKVQSASCKVPTGLNEVSIIIPVHNEEKYLPYSLKPLADLRDTPIIFVLDRCQDGSEAIVRKFARKRDNVTVLKKEDDSKTDNPAWEAYLTGAEQVRRGRVLFLGADVIMDTRVFCYLNRARLLKFRYVNYASHFWYTFEKTFQRFTSKSYFLECIDVNLIHELPFMSESYNDIVQGRTKLTDILNAVSFNRKFVNIDSVECLHLRPFIPEDRQLLQGYVRHMQGVPLLKVLMHSLIYRKPHVFRGYVFRMFRKRRKNGQ
jgi:glycosyltransferase involved in cell wall biosynthesis